ncbi:hypothetical protein ACWGMA_29760 [Streptomyces asiaticus]
MAGRAAQHLLDVAGDRGQNAGTDLGVQVDGQLDPFFGHAVRVLFGGVLLGGQRGVAKVVAGGAGDLTRSA